MDKTPPPWEKWVRALQAADEALPEIEVVYRDHPSLPQYRGYLQRKCREFRARVGSLVERN
jgi:hypothetical protein